MISPLWPLIGPPDKITVLIGYQHWPMRFEILNSHILQFQFYRSMCEAADLFPKNPLYKCDFDGNEAAGKKLNDGLMMGMSEDWRVTLKARDPQTGRSKHVWSIQRS